MERRRLRGYIQRPSADQVKALARMEYIDFTDEEAEAFTELIADSLDAVDYIDELPQPQIPVKWNERNPGYRPTKEEDPYNLFIRKCLVKGAETGKLAGKRIAVKDNIAIAGIPMSNGSKAFLDLVPDFDAVVVERLLDNGANIVGKFNQDDMSFCGTSETSPFGQVRNPLNPEFSPGGSSSAAGAVLVAGEADLSIASDQAGSARIPAAWTGVYAIKPTHGLVPSFGSAHMDHTLDFISPVAKTVSDLALLLEVIAGEDRRDPQWVRGPIQVDNYSEALDKDITGMKIGILTEGFDWAFSDPEVNNNIRKATKRLESMGASIKEVSLPTWKNALPIWLTLTAHSVSAMIESDGQGYWHGGASSPTFAESFGKSRRLESNRFPPIVKLTMIMGKYLRRNYYSAYFAKAQNLRNELRQQIDALLETVDILVTPTTPTKPFKLLTENISDSEWAERAIANLHNTAALNLTGHPALVMPCGMDTHSLPSSMQLIGKHWEESKLFQIASALEQKENSRLFETVSRI